MFIRGRSYCFLPFQQKARFTMARANEKTARITGSTDGVGRMVAERLGQDGWRVLVHGRDRGRGIETERLAECALSALHTLRHEAVFGCTVKRLAFCAHCFAFAGVPLALLHEAHFSGAVKWLPVRTHCLVLTGLRCRGARCVTGNQHR